MLVNNVYGRYATFFKNHELKGADEGSETRSSLMWETIHIIQQMGV